MHKIVFLGIIIFILLNSMKCQNKNEEISETIMEPINDTICIESPIMARLEIEKKEKTLTAVLTFANMSEQDVIVEQNKLGGEKLKEHIFHLNPWYTSPNLTFKPYNSLLSGKKEKYITMKPQEVIVTYTDLSKYYNFNERSYDTLSISYVVQMKYLTKELNQITQKDTDGRTKPVVFYIFSNDIDLDYNKDIKPYL